MDLLHTADLHLKRDDKKGLEVLNWIIGKIHELKVGYLIVSGDLFDSDKDATVLRPAVKPIFESTRSKILVIPGNHDANSYSNDYDYGRNVIQLYKQPYQFFEADGFKICAVPYQDTRFGNSIKNIETSIDLLICHGTLYDPSFIFSALDEEARYMPIYPTNLEGLARYVALGHLHNRYINRDYETTKAVYPGSPIALDTKCTSPRIVCHVKIDQRGVRVDPITVDISPYWTALEYFVYPGIEDQVFKKIAGELQGMKKKDIMPFITVRGFISIPEHEFSKNIERLETDFKPAFPGFMIAPGKIASWDRVMQNKIVHKFVEKTAGLDDDLRMKIFEITFPVFSDIIL